MDWPFSSMPEGAECVAECIIMVRIVWCRFWTDEKDDFLVQQVRELGTSNWDQIMQNGASVFTSNTKAGFQSLYFIDAICSNGTLSEGGRLRVLDMLTQTWPGKCVVSERDAQSII